MKELLKPVLTFLFKLIVIFYSVKICFWAMNKASTVGNLLGFVGLVIVGVYFFYEVKQITNKLNNQ